jgi:succinate-semialdehyde dehydrogenase/glutarate-semialdehyde dehydrogenase
VATVGSLSAIATVNPATGERIREFEPLSEDAIEQKLRLASLAATEWRHTAMARRVQLLESLADILEQEKSPLGALMTLEMGKLHSAAIAEAAKCATACRFYAERGPALLAPEPQEADKDEVVIRYDPLGVVLAVMPWNFPFWQVIRFAAPAVMAGNVVLLKHASNVPQCALAIEELFARAGAPAGVFQTLLVGSGAVEGLIADSRVAAVTLTGSEGAGRSVAAAAGKAIKPAVLELGGSDAFIVMPSADLDKAVSVGVHARTMNNGQSCIAAKRFIVHDAIADAFEAKFVAAMQALVVGNPMDEKVALGPLATSQGVEDLERQITASVSRGARVAAGGTRLPRAGNYFAATVLTNVPRDAPAYSEEMFGPVAVLHRVASAKEAIRVANDVDYGLGASAWTSDRSEAELFTREIEAGSVFINAMVASDPRYPFGGIKRSGYGRELGAYGIRAFTNVKTVRIDWHDVDSSKAATE